MKALTDCRNSVASLEPFVSITLTTIGPRDWCAEANSSASEMSYTS
jgi:hypothetical protein